MIRVEKLTFGFRDDICPVFNNFSISFENNDISAIIGKSGVGKSTLLALLAGIYIKTDLFGRFDGNIIIDGNSPEMLRGPLNISLMHQKTVLLDHLTIKQNILLSSEIIKNNNTSARYRYLMSELGLDDCEDLRPSELSGGMETRVALARTLLSSPKYLYLDEPFTSLDIKTRWQIYKLLREERSKNGYSTILTTHDIFEAVILASKIIILKKDDKNNCEYSYFDNSPPNINVGSIEDNIFSIKSFVERAIRLM